MHPTRKLCPFCVRRPARSTQAVVAVLQLVGTSAGSPRIDQPCSMDSVAAKQRMPSTSKTNAVSANAAYQQSRKLKLSSEYHESRSPSRRSAPSQMQRHKSVSASSAHQEGLAAMYRPKAAPPPLHAMQASHPLPPMPAPNPVHPLLVRECSWTYPRIAPARRCSSMACPDQTASRPLRTTPLAAASAQKTRRGAARSMPAI